MLDNSEIDPYLDTLGIHIQIIIAMKYEDMKLFIPSWRNIVIPEFHLQHKIARKICEEEIEKSWKLIPK